GQLNQVVIVGVHPSPDHTGFAVVKNEGCARAVGRQPPRRKLGVSCEIRSMTVAFDQKAVAVDCRTRAKNMYSGYGFKEGAFPVERLIRIDAAYVKERVQLSLGAGNYAHAPAQRAVP